jgi:hypothetical protein
MFVYWMMYLLPALGALQERGSRPAASAYEGRARNDAAWLWVIVMLGVIVGCRFQVGGDWENYIDNLTDAYGRSLYESLLQGDPGYRLLEWLAYQLDMGILVINLVAATVFTYGLSVFCRNLPRPWLGLAVAVPYLVIIVGMGYTRQGMAIGCAMAGLVSLSHRKVLRFLLWIVVGATFHKTAVLLFPIAALSATQGRLLAFVWTVGFAVAAYALMLDPAVEGLRASYIEAEYQSEGALIRLLMNAAPASLFLLLRKRFAINAQEQKLWTCLSIVSLALFAVYFLTPASTAVDRVALYVLPLQMVVFSHLPQVFGNGRRQNRLAVYSVLVYYVAVEFVWLNFAVNSEYWIPYQFYLFQTWH